MTEAKPEPPAKLIAELAADPDFPTNAVGQRVDVRGFIGVIVEVVKNSIKVRSAEGNTVSYNFHALRRLYGPRIETVAPSFEPPPVEPPARPKVERPVILEPNFDSPPVSIETLVHQPNFPKCAYGTYIDFHGFAGVVVELIDRSLKVQSPQGSTRRYNADGLLKIYNQPPPPGAGGPPT